MLKFYIAVGVFLVLIALIKGDKISDNAAITFVSMVLFVFTWPLILLAVAFKHRFEKDKI